MSAFLDAAYRVLQAESKPMTAAAITAEARRRGWLESAGETPEQTMKSKLSTDILRKKDKSLFMRTEQANFGLRAWRDRYSEYVADRYQKAPLDEEAVVFDAAILTDYIPHRGLLSSPLRPAEELIAQCRPMLRREAEENHAVVQLVSGFIVHYKDLYLTYKRSARLPEKRLHHEYSLSFGGHLTPQEVFPEGADQLFNIFEPIYGGYLLERELGEELRLEERPEFQYRGLLYDDSRDISRQHLAIVYDVALRSKKYVVGERGYLLDDKFETLEEMEGRLDEFENWSQILIRAERRRRQA